MLWVCWIGLCLVKFEFFFLFKIYREEVVINYVRGILGVIKCFVCFKEMWFFMLMYFGRR